VRALGAQPCRALDRGITLKETMARLAGLGINRSVTIGADVIDGSYDPVFSARLLVITDLLSRSGVACSVTGFSLSKAPYPALASIFDNFDSRVIFNLRDPDSFERFKKFTKAPAKLVADVAFLLVPANNTPSTEPIATWVDAQRAAGRKVLGVNIHPLLLEPKDRHLVGKMVLEFSKITASLIENGSVSLVFMEHDFRGTSADALGLGPLYEALQPRFRDFLYFPKDKLSAAELKTTASYLDGIVTGRMHLMIASLGVGTPVFCLEYKDKMQGLLKHFNMSTKYLVTAWDILNQPDRLKVLLSEFTENTENLRTAVIAQKGNIRAKSLLNLENLK
jgi:polysaccharide pyruvyl transferase WcaK-like protein